MERGFARPGADLGADWGADFFSQMRVFPPGLVSAAASSTSWFAMDSTLSSTSSALGSFWNILHIVFIFFPAKRTASFHLPVYLRLFRCVRVDSSYRVSFSTVSPQYELPTFPDVMS